MSNNLHEILMRPVLSEQASTRSEKYNTVTFRVLLTASKNDVRRAVEELYNVGVAKVRTLINPGKVKRRGQSVGRRPNVKKAMVTLKPGQTIDFFAAE